MKRNAQKSIENWYQSKNALHLYITGMRGTGKTTMIDDFLKDHTDERYLYINFESDINVRSAFIEALRRNYGKNTSIFQIVEEVYYFGPEDIRPGLIVMDEIHTVSESKTIFRLAAMTNECRLIFTDSENPVNDSFFKSDKSIDDAFEKLRVFPLTFDEFLINTGKEWYHDVIVGHFERMRPVPELVHNEINDILFDYLGTGGFPEIVGKYIDNDCKPEKVNSAVLLPKELRNILYAVLEYTGCDNKKTQAFLDGTIQQLIEHEKHFTFTKLVKGSTYNYYKQVIESLCDSGILLKASFKDHYRFFWGDTGLLRMKIVSSYNCERELLDEVTALNFIAQHLAAGNPGLEYWCSENTSQIDHIISYKGRRVPLKYIGDSKRRIRPLQIYSKEFNPEEMIAVTDSNFYIMGSTKFIPLYAVFCLNQ